MSLLLLITALTPVVTERSVFFPPEVVEAARRNVEAHAWARTSRDTVARLAQPWMAMSDDELWALMFGNTIKRSWMVWSNGHCPSCQQSVPMYTWEIDALARPWKVRCPHCKDLFPKNDFARYYRSGLDEHGVFQPHLADRSLLFNEEHPDPADPLHYFGVDDGDGYVEGDKRWRFIGAYLIYGQWKQAVLGGIVRLANAYTLTGDPAYAHKAGVLLDRVADLYPTFDFQKEGVLYEGPGSAGYISTWHDACEETRHLVLAYDQIRPALAVDTGLVRFLAEKAAQHKLENPKRSWADIRRNIEDRILRDPVTNRQKIYSNYPRTELALATILMVLGWPENRQEVFGILDPMFEKATAVDGVTGEKGLAGYSAFTIQGVAVFLGQLIRRDPDILRELIHRHPKIRDMFRFHLDTWCLYRYYPHTGDAGSFATRVDRYAAVQTRTDAGIEPSGFDLLIRLSQVTGDPAFVQLAFLMNGRKVTGLPHDIFCRDPEAVQRYVTGVVRQRGVLPKLSSVNKEQWCLGILRGGRGTGERAVWLDYDAGGAHGHLDALNLGLFAFGLDLLPEMGYPPVQFGGWGSPRARWYVMTASHNTVVVDRRNQKHAQGRCTLWADGRTFQAIRAECHEASQTDRYERTVAVSDAGQSAFYLVDVFRVAGGNEHVKFQHSHFGPLSIAGVALSPIPDFGNETQMRDMRLGPMPVEGAIAEWQVEDRYRLLPTGTTTGLRHWELTQDADIGRCEAWISPAGYNTPEETWIPRLVVRRQGENLRSTFVAVMEPHAGQPVVRTARRLSVRESGSTPSVNAQHVGVEVLLKDGSRDVVVVSDPEVGIAALVIPGTDITLEGDLCHVRWDSRGQLRKVVLIGCRRLTVGEYTIATRITSPRAVVELSFANNRVDVVSGREVLGSITRKGVKVL